MLAKILSRLFPPKLGKIDGVDAVLRRHAIATGLLKVYKAESPKDSGPGRVWEWPEGRHRRGRRIR